MPMRAHCVAIDRVRYKPYQAACDEYLKRLKRYLRFDVRELKPSRHREAAMVREQEGALLLAAVPKKSALIVLDERGCSLSSNAFESKLSKYLDSGRAPCFLIGGANGHAQEVRDRAVLILRLSAMTLPHELARVMLYEQLYRAMTIRRGEPYHK